MLNVGIGFILHFDSYQSTLTLMKVDHNYSQIKRNQLLPGLGL